MVMVTPSSSSSYFTLRAIMGDMTALNQAVFLCSQPLLLSSFWPIFMTPTKNIVKQKGNDGCFKYLSESATIFEIGLIYILAELNNSCQYDGNDTLSTKKALTEHGILWVNSKIYDSGWIQCQRSIQYPFEWEQFDCYLLKVKFQIPSLSETSYGLGPKIAKKRKSESIAILINLSRGTYCNVCAILQYWSPSQQNSYLTHVVNPTCFRSEIVNPTCFTLWLCMGVIKVSQWIGREILNPKHMWKSKFRLLELIQDSKCYHSFFGSPCT